MKKVYFIIFLLTSLIGFSQNDVNIESKKGELFLNIGTEYRITPYYKSFPNNLKNNTNIDAQNSGVAFSYGLSYFVSDKISLNFSNSFRYDLLLYPENENYSGKNYFQKAENTVFIDFHSYLDYYFKLSSNRKLLIRLGYSLMNNGSNYVVSETLYDDASNVVGYSTSQNDFSFFAGNIGLGFKKNKFEILLGSYVSKNTNYFNYDTRLTLPYLKLSYIVTKL